MQTRPPMATDPQLQVRLPPELRTRLFAEAERRMVSVNILTVRALEHALDQWEQQQLP